MVISWLPVQLFSNLSKSYSTTQFATYSSYMHLLLRHWAISKIWHKRKFCATDNLWIWHRIYNNLSIAWCYPWPLVNLLWKNGTTCHISLLSFLNVTICIVFCNRKNYRSVLSNWDFSSKWELPSLLSPSFITWGTTETTESGDYINGFD